MTPPLNRKPVKRKRTAPVTKPPRPNFQEIATKAWQTRWRNVLEASDGGKLESYITFAQKHGVSVSTLYTRIRRAKVKPARSVSRVALYRRVDLEKLLKPVEVQDGLIITGREERDVTDTRTEAEELIAEIVSDQMTVANDTSDASRAFWVILNKTPVITSLWAVYYALTDDDTPEGAKKYLHDALRFIAQRIEDEGT